MNGWTYFSLSFWWLWFTFKASTSTHTRSSEIAFSLRLQNVREQKCHAHSSKNIYGCSYILTYEEESKTKEHNSWLVTTFVESVHTEVQEPPKWRRAQKRQCTLSVCILVCLCTYVKETTVNVSPCFIAKRCWDHHMLVSWWHTLLAPLPCHTCLFQALSSSLPVPLCVSLLSYRLQYKSDSDVILLWLLWVHVHVHSPCI